MRIADDFGLGRAHDRVILSLLETGRLDGTSVMMSSALKSDDIAKLQELRRNGIKIGLHLNLTEELPGTGPKWPLPQILRPMLSKQTLDAISKSLSEQTTAFIELFGSPPDYYDGHQHCHCFPSIAPLVSRLPYGPSTWVRAPLPATLQGIWLNFRAGGAKTLLIMAFAARAKRLFIRAGLQTNIDFSGFLRLDDPANVRQWLPRLLSSAGPQCLIMLHPGDDTDPMQCKGHAPASRSIEAKILEGSLKE